MSDSPTASVLPPRPPVSTPADCTASDAQELRDRYVKNLCALYRRDADLAARIDAMPFAEVPSIERARDGAWTVRMKSPDGRTTYLHSRYAPLDEARRQIATTSPGDSPESETATAVVIFGFGLGYHVTALEETRPRPAILVVEPDLRIIKAALCATDLTPALDSNRLTILTQADRGTVHARLGRMQADLMLGTRSVNTAAASIAPAFHTHFRAALLDFVSATRMQMLTLLRTSRVTFENVAMNLPSYLRSRGVEALKDAAAGYPAILVAAGPSLARNLDQLTGLRERAVIIGVQTIFKLLLSFGVRPHFVTSLDFHSVSAEFFRDVGEISDCALVAEPKATWHVPDEFRGPRHILRHRFHDVLLREANPSRAALPPGSTVAHLAYYLAEHLGCDPIIMVGQDLSFTDGLFYLPGSPIEDIWAPELGRYQTIEMKQWERIVRNRPILRRAPSINGGEIYTDDLLFTYAEQFQRDFASRRGRVIQASEGGLALEGATCMPLRDAVSQYCRRELPADLFAKSRQPETGVDLRRAVDAIGSRLQEVRRVREIAREALGVVEALHGLIDSPREFNARIARLDELRLLMAENASIYSLVVDVSATAELRRHREDRRNETDAENAASARRRLARDRAYLGELMAGCDFIEQVLPRVIDRLRGENP